MNCICTRKKVIILSLLLGLAISAAAAAGIGDVNNDGTVNIVDSLLVARYSAGLPDTAFELYVADFNCDGKVNITDALLIARFTAGLVPDSSCQPVLTPAITPTITPTPTGTRVATPAPTGLIVVDTNLEKTMPESEFSIQLSYQDADGTASCEWQLYELPVETEIGIFPVSGTLTSSGSTTITGSINWAYFPAGATTKRAFYIYAVTNTNKRYCKVIRLNLSKPGPTPIPTPCGNPSLGISGNSFNLTYPATSFSFNVGGSGACTSGFSVITPPVQPATALAFEPAQGGVKSGAPATTINGTLDWSGIPAGGAQDYYALVKWNNCCVISDKWGLVLVTVHADRPME